jgi:hypothetical protein
MRMGIFPTNLRIKRRAAERRRVTFHIHTDAYADVKVGMGTGILIPGQ